MFEAHDAQCKRHGCTRTFRVLEDNRRQLYCSPGCKSRIENEKRQRKYQAKRAMDRRVA